MTKEKTTRVAREFAYWYNSYSAKWETRQTSGPNPEGEIRVREVLDTPQSDTLETQPTDYNRENEIDEAALSEEIYEPKYGGKDHSGYDTMMLYEVNYERNAAFCNGAKWADSNRPKELKKDKAVQALLKIMESFYRKCWCSQETKHLDTCRAYEEWLAKFGGLVNITNGK